MSWTLQSQIITYSLSHRRLKSFTRPLQSHHDVSQHHSATVWLRPRWITRARTNNTTVPGNGAEHLITTNAAKLPSVHTKRYKTARYGA